VTEPAARTPAPTLPAALPFAARARETADELELRHALRGGVIGGAVSIPNQSAGILIQPDGREWRQFRNRVLTIGGLVALLLVVLALAAFYLMKGTKRLEHGRSGRKVARYTLVERVNHWMVAASFVVLALTGLNIIWGAYVLRPLIGPSAFTAVTFYGQAVHQFVAFAFMVGLLVMIVHWFRPNLPARVDLAWIRAGGPFARGHPPAGKFNAAQKALYFASMIGGIAVAVSGILLMAPHLLDDVVLQQWAHIVHGLVAFGMIALIIGHAYIGSVGQEGAFEAMRDGEVDYNWAREHHSLWLEEELAKARSTVAPEAPASARPAGAD
ncbi:formate dehydrogenase subunit gamma, partial [Falsiroseomonas oryziterrae]|uniref:formate dehydrogenase subunit gamma n=1 Tax=Falsiroseomonas oryziterrae TaxID=2911368 RepID=UPI001F021AEB